MEVEATRFLFALPNMAGNAPPILEVARRLASRGHSIRVLASSSLRDSVETRHCVYVPFRQAPDVDVTMSESWKEEGVSEITWVLEKIMMGPALGYARDVCDELQANPADAAVIDPMIPGALMGAEASQIPSALLLHSVYSYPAPGLPAFGMGLLPPETWMGRTRDALLTWAMFRMARKHLGAFNEARAELKLEPLKSIWETIDRANRVLVMTAQAFDFKAKELPDHVQYVGPQLEPSVPSGWDSPWPSSDRRPLVLVGLSTSAQGQEPLLRKLIGVLGEIEVRALVTTGPAIDPNRFDAPANVVVRSFVPHAAVMPESALVITHAGHGTVIRALAAGVPLVCIPLGRDQPDVATRVVWHGAGVKLATKVKPSVLRREIKKVLDDVSYREAARRMAKAIAEETERDLAVQELEALASPH